MRGLLSQNMKASQAKAVKKQPAPVCRAGSVVCPKLHDGAVGGQLAAAKKPALTFSAQDPTS